MPEVPEETPAEPAQAEPIDLGTTDGRTVLGGTAWTTITAFVPPLQTLIVSIIAARFLGTEGFGQQSLIAFVSISCSLVLAARMPAALSRFGAQLVGAGQPAMLHRLYLRTFHVQVVIGAVLVLGFAGLAALGADPPAAWILGGFATYAAVVQAAPAALLASTQRWRDNVIPGTVTVSVACLAMVVVLGLGGGVVGYFAVDVAMVTANLVWTRVLASRVSVRLPRPEPLEPKVEGEVRRFVRASTFYAVIEFVVLKRSEILFLNHFSTAAQVGFYSIAFAASEAVARFPAILTSVALPAVANLHGAGEHDRIRRGYWRAVRFLAAVCPPFVIVAAALGSDLIGIIYGDKFAPAETVVVILLIPYAILPMSGLSDALLWTFGRIRFIVAWGIAAAVVDLGAALILVPRFDAVGAAIASDLGSLTAGLPALWLSVRLMRPLDLRLGSQARNLLVTVAIGAAAVLPVVFLGGVVGLVVGGVAVLLVGWFVGRGLGLLEPDDAQWLAATIGDRAGGRVGPLVLGFSRPIGGNSSDGETSG
jgi:O-antigen/teichoic acid export membrane protein